MERGDMGKALLWMSQELLAAPRLCHRDPHAAALAMEKPEGLVLGAVIRDRAVVGEGAVLRLSLLKPHSPPQCSWSAC